MQSTDLHTVLRLQRALLTALRRSPCAEWVVHTQVFVQNVGALRSVERSVLGALLLAAAGEIRGLMENRHAAVPPEWWDVAMASRRRSELLDGFSAYVTTLVRASHVAGAGQPVEAAKAFIEAHYAERLTTSFIAQTVGRERTYLATLFRRATGQTLHGYLMAVRMRYAVARLLDGEKVESAMLSVGYRSKRSFYRDCRAMTGLTPAGVRHQRRGSNVPA